MFVSIDYAAAILQAKKLENIAEECDEILRGVERQQSVINGTWEGEAAEAMQEKLDGYKQRNLQLQSEIRETADSIRQVVQIIREADEAVARNAAHSSGSGHNAGGGRHG